MSDDVLRRELTPRGLFTNLFPVTLPAGSLGAIRQAGVDAVKKDDVADRKRPSFYETRTTLFAYGPGLDDFRDPRFGPGIVTAETDAGFTRRLLLLGLADALRAKGYVVQLHHQGLTATDPKAVIKSASSGALHVVPAFGCQPVGVEDTTGARRFAFSVVPSTATASTFHLGPSVAGHANKLQGVKLRLDCPECTAACPLFARQQQLLGVFDGFAAAGTPLDSGCACEDYVPLPVRVLDRHGDPDGDPAPPGRGNTTRDAARGATRAAAGDHRARRGRGGTPRAFVVPGQVVAPTLRQRRLLKLTRDGQLLEREGRVWLGDLTPKGNVREAALQVRYQRVQEFLARAAGGATAPLQFALPTGPTAVATLGRLPLAVEELSHA